MDTDNDLSHEEMPGGDYMRLEFYDGTRVAERLDYYLNTERLAKPLQHGRLKCVACGATVGLENLLTTFWEKTWFSRWFWGRGRCRSYCNKPDCAAEYEAWKAMRRK
jgi:hypothetical protein